MRKSMFAPMVKGGLAAIITSDEILFSTLLHDPATRDKSYLIPSREKLVAAIKEIYQEY